MNNRREDFFRYGLIYDIIAVVWTYPYLIIGRILPTVLSPIGYFAAALFGAIFFCIPSFLLFIIGSNLIELSIPENYERWKKHQNEISEKEHNWFIRHGWLK